MEHGPEEAINSRNEGAVQFRSRRQRGTANYGSVAVDAAGGYDSVVSRVEFINGAWRNDVGNETGGMDHEKALFGVAGIDRFWRKRLSGGVRHGLSR